MTATELRDEVIRGFVGPLDGVAALTESPIELLFFWACVAAANLSTELVFGDETSPDYWPGQVTKEWATCGVTDTDPAGQTTVLGVQPEVRLSDGRVVRLDFALCITRPWAKFTERVCIAIECDGHDFHEKTKEQARRDKKRDRDLQVAGWKIVRFSGSEIFRDPVGCVTQAFKLAWAQFAETAERINKGAR